MVLHLEEKFFWRRHLIEIQERTGKGENNESVWD
jgi:hypothetical protein